MADIGEISGPVDYAVFRFPGNQFTGEIVPALQELVSSGTVRILDLIFVTKDAEGNVAGVELGELPDETRTAYDELDGEILELLTEDDIQQASQWLEPESSAALLVWENTWASRFAQAVRNANGEVVAFERIPREAFEASLAGTEE